MLMPEDRSARAAAFCSGDLVEFAEEIADAVRKVHLQKFRRGVRVEIKDDGTPVTEIDRLAELTVRKMIAAEFPTHGVIGEEFPAHQTDADFVWVVDPLDGTQLYLMGKPLFGLLLAVAYRGRFILGLIDHAALDERWIGINGRGTFHNGSRVRTRKCPSLGDTMLVRPGHRAGGEKEDRAIDAFSQHSRWVQWGLTPYDYGLLVSGHIDLIVSAGPKLHDLAPLDPIIRNGGGGAVDWLGQPLTLASSGTLVACGDKDLLPEVISLLRLECDRALSPRR
jgi:inositol-phosphate phosphatase/L-galactose 1-phosphate phosphatase/histidinol-phosphatase